MGKWIDDLNSALGEFSRPGQALGESLSAGGASPADLGQAIRAIFGGQQSGLRPHGPHEAGERLRKQFEGAALGLKDALPISLHQFELRVASELRGKPDAQRQAGLVLASDFKIFGRSAAGHFLADPRGSAWEDLPRYNTNGSWICLGWPRGSVPRPIVTVEHVREYTQQLEGERLRAIAEFQAEERRRDDAARAAWERSPAGRVQALESELARLKAGQPAA